MAASRFQHKVQRAPTRSILLCSSRWVAFGRDRVGDAQVHAAPLARSTLWRVQRSACLAFLADVGLHPRRRAAGYSGFRRRVGYVAQHDRRLVNKSRGGRRSSQMNHKENGDDSLQPKDTPSTGIEPKQEISELPEASPADANSSIPIATAKPEAVEATEQQLAADRSPSLSAGHEPRTDETPSSVAAKQKTVESPEAGPKDARPSVEIAITKPEGVEATEQQGDAARSPSSSVDHEPQTDEAASSIAAKSVSVKKPQSFFGEQPLPAIEIDPSVLRCQSRRDFLVFGAGALAALAGAGFLLPQDT